MSSIGMDGQRVQLGSSIFRTIAVTGSPAAAAETIVATLVLPVGIRADQNVMLDGWAAFTVGTNGTAIQLRLRQTNVAGTVVAASGALGATAAALIAPNISGSDAPGAVNNQTYVMTLTVTAGSATSTVSAVFLRAMVV